MRSNRVIVLACLGVAVAGCNLVLGLDSLKQCPQECDGGDASGLDATADADAGDAADAFVLPDGASEASSWANFRMENPPAEVEACAPPASSASFDAGIGFVHDDVTGRFWNLSVGVAKSIEAATAFCNGLSPGTWRVPTRIELVTLLDTTGSGSPRIEPPFLAPLADAGVGSANFLWTSSYVRPIDTELRFWFASLQSGDMTRVPADKVGSAGVLCVR